MKKLLIQSSILFISAAGYAVDYFNDSGGISGNYDTWNAPTFWTEKVYYYDNGSQVIGTKTGTAPTSTDTMTFISPSSAANDYSIYIGGSPNLNIDKILFRRDGTKSVNLGIQANGTVTANEINMVDANGADAANGGNLYIYGGGANDKGLTLNVKKIRVTNLNVGSWGGGNSTIKFEIKDGMTVEALATFHINTQNKNGYENTNNHYITHSGGNVIYNSLGMSSVDNKKSGDTFTSTYDFTGGTMTIGDIRITGTTLDVATPSKTQFKFIHDGGKIIAKNANNTVYNAGNQDHGNMDFIFGGKVDANGKSLNIFEVGADKTFNFSSSSNISQKTDENGGFRVTGDGIFTMNAKGSLTGSVTIDNTVSKFENNGGTSYKTLVVGSKEFTIGDNTSGSVSDFLYIKGNGSTDIKVSTTSKAGTFNFVKNTKEIRLGSGQKTSLDHGSTASDFIWYVAAGQKFTGTGVIINNGSQQTFDNGRAFGTNMIMGGTFDPSSDNGKIGHLQVYGDLVLTQTSVIKIDVTGFESGMYDTIKAFWDGGSTYYKIFAYDGDGNCGKLIFDVSDLQAAGLLNIKDIFLVKGSHSESGSTTGITDLSMFDIEFVKDGIVLENTADWINYTTGDINFNLIPEPATIASILGAMSLLLVIRKKR